MEEQDLLDAAMEGNAADIQLVLEDLGEDAVNATVDEDGFTALHFAAASGNVQAVSFLLQTKADVSRKAHDGSTAATVALEDGHTEIANMIVSYKSETSTGAPPAAAAAAAALRAESQAEVTASHDQSQSGSQEEESATQPPVVVGGHRQEPSLQAFFDTVMEGDVDFVKEAYTHLTSVGGRNVNTIFDEDGYSPLQLAAACGHERVVAFLLELKARVSYRAPDGSTALSMAREDGHLNVEDLLLPVETRHDHASVPRKHLNIDSKNRSAFDEQEQGDGVHMLIDEPEPVEKNRSPSESSTVKSSVSEDASEDFFDSESDDVAANATDLELREGSSSVTSDDDREFGESETRSPGGPQSEGTSQRAPVEKNSVVILEEEVRSQHCEHEPSDGSQGESRSSMSLSTHVGEEDSDEYISTNTLPSSKAIPHKATAMDLHVRQATEGGEATLRSFIERLTLDVFGDDDEKDQDVEDPSKPRSDIDAAASLPHDVSYHAALQSFDILQRQLGDDCVNVKEFLLTRLKSGSRVVNEIMAQALAVEMSLHELLLSDRLAEALEATRVTNAEEGGSVLRENTLCVDFANSSPSGDTDTVQTNPQTTGVSETSQLGRLGQLSQHVGLLEVARNRLISLRDMEKQFQDIKSLIQACEAPAIGHGNTANVFARALKVLNEGVDAIGMHFSRNPRARVSELENIQVQPGVRLWSSRALFLVQQLRSCLERQLVKSLRRMGWPNKIVIKQGENLEAALSAPREFFAEMDESTQRQNLAGEEVIAFAQESASLAALQNLDRRMHAFAERGCWDSESQATEPQASWLGHLLWAPVETRLRFHFAGNKVEDSDALSSSTAVDAINRVDKPEWFLYYVVRVLHGAHGFLHDIEAAFKQSGLFRDNPALLPPFAWFSERCFRFVRDYFSWVWAQMSSTREDPLLCHTVRQILTFEQVVEAGGYNGAGIGARTPLQQHLVSRTTNHLHSLIGHCLKTHRVDSSIAAGISVGARASHALFFSAEHPPLGTCLALQDIPLPRSPTRTLASGRLCSELARNWLRYERASAARALLPFFPEVELVGLSLFDDNPARTTRDSDTFMEAVSENEHWSIPQRDVAASARRQFKVSSALERRKLAQLIPLPTACLTVLNILAQAMDTCAAIPAAEAELLVLEGLIEPILEAVVFAIGNLVQNAAETRMRWESPQFWTFMCGIANTIAAVHDRLAAVEIQPFALYLAEFRGTLARAQQLLAAFSDASEAEHDSQAHGVLVGGLLDFAKGLHSAAGKVAGSVRSVASSTGRKSSNSEQDDDGLGPEVTGSGRRANAGGGDTAKKGGAQAKKVLLSLGNRLGSLGESLGGRTLRTIGSASQKLEVLGDRTLSAVGALTSARRWFGNSKQAPRLELDHKKAHNQPDSDETMASTPSSNSETGERHHEELQQVPIGRNGSDHTHKELPRSSSELLIGQFDTKNGDEEGLFERYIQACRSLLGVSAVNTVDESDARSLASGRSVAKVLADTIAAEFVELAETYANNEEQWVEALGPVQHLTASEPGAALKWVPTAVSVQVHDAVAQMRLRLVSISTLLQDERAAQAIGEKLSLKLCAFFLEKVLWEKPFSVPGVGQLAADVAAASQCIARLLGFGVENGTNESTNLGATSQRSGSVATAQRFMDVDKVIRANSCLREVQECLRLLALPLPVLKRLRMAYNDHCPVIARNASRYTATMANPDPDVLLAQQRQIERQQKVELDNSYNGSDEDDELQVSATGPEDLATILASHGVRRLGIYRAYCVMNLRVDMFS
eukprot:INCI14005.1.p1 GENE.INCI14005.1~~INCI14005.1.p1  ORF type:complete len:1780 (-),score=322.38 INCI14005.1:105-5444(-)